MITDLEISGYKGLGSLSLTGLRRLTLIGGCNNVGKTSLLEAIFTAHDWGNPELLTRHLHWRGVDSFQANADAWSSAFAGFKLSGKIQVKIKNSAGGREAFLAQLLEDTRGALPTTASKDSAENIRAPGEQSLRVSFTRGSRPVFEAVVQVNRAVPPFSFRSTKASEPAPHLFYAIARNRSSAAEDAQAFGLLDEKKLTEPVVKALQVIEPRLESLSVIPVGPQPLLYADVKGLPRKVPVNLLGDGVSRLLTLLIQITKLRGGYLLVDEIENGFHYSTMRDVWRVLYIAAKENQCQIFASTHSYECLTAYADALGELAPDDYSFVRLDKTIEVDSANKAVERISAAQYDSTALRNAIDGHWEVR